MFNNFIRLKNYIFEVYRSIKQYFLWIRDVNKYCNFVKIWLESSDNVKITETNKIGIIVQPWLGTAVPWFLITMALFMYNKGIKPLIIFDDLIFGEDIIFFKFQKKGISKILFLLSKKFDILTLSDYKVIDVNFTLEDKSFIEKLSEYNSIHHCRGELDIIKREKYISTIKKQFEYNLPRIKKLYKDMDFNFIILAGGVYGSSSQHLEQARLNNTRVTTIDAGLGVVLISTNGIAAQLTDISKAFNLLNDSDYEKINLFAQKIFEERKIGKDIFKSQIIDYKSGLNADVGILLPLNIVWDSAALGMMALFNSTSDWIIESIEWLLRNTRENITIRQHPHERKKEGFAEDDYSKVILEKFGNHERIHFISCYDNINTYNLIENSKLVICLSSTIGVEAAMMKIPIIVVSNCYYSELGFVIKPKNKDEYFNSIKEVINGQITLSKEKIKAATKCYYLTQYCNWVKTDFTPVVEDFEKWVNIKPSDLFKIDFFHDYFYAVKNNVPMSIIQHKKFIEHNKL